MLEYLDFVDVDSSLNFSEYICVETCGYFAILNAYDAFKLLSVES